MKLSRSAVLKADKLAPVRVLALCRQDFEFAGHDVVVEDLVQVTEDSIKDIDIALFSAGGADIQAVGASIRCCRRDCN